MAESLSLAGFEAALAFKVSEATFIEPRARLQPGVDVEAVEQLRCPASQSRLGLQALLLEAGKDRLCVCRDFALTDFEVLAPPTVDKEELGWAQDEEPLLL